MVDCSVKILSKGLKWSDSRESKGTMAYDDCSFIINYKIDGDDCTLNFLDGELVQLRRGQHDIEMHFVKNKRTSCFIGVNGGRGQFDILTRVLDCKIERGLIKLQLKYLNGDEIISLSLTVKSRS